MWYNIPKKISMDKINIIAIDIRRGFIWNSESLTEAYLNYGI